LVSCKLFLLFFFSFWCLHVPGWTTSFWVSILNFNCRALLGASDLSFPVTWQVES
jgi:hypothetical protein